MKNFLILFLLVALTFLSCKKHDDETTDSVTANINGFVQKGPFINGSSITLNELTNTLTPTGKTFNIQITDNRGTFQLSNITLVSPFVNLRADGFYFNEVTGIQSVAQLTLYCLSDISNKTNVNVNLLSHLEKPRTEYLISQGTPFNLAKKQAEKDVLKIFNIQKENIPESELLDITQSGDDNAILLAVSLILQGYRTEAELSELLSEISYDIRVDGILTDSTLGSQLINDAKYLKLNEIRQNIITRWTQLGITDNISDFETYIINFINNTEYSFTNFISYPNSGLYGINVLNNTDSVFTSGNYYSLSAFLPKGSSLKIMTNGNAYGAFAYAMGSLDGLTDLGPDGTYVWRTFISNKTGLITMKVRVNGVSTLYLYENGDSIPTWTKNLYIN